MEDRLSDALHERLTQQFVDRPSAVIARYDPSELVRMRQADDHRALAALLADPEVRARAPEPEGVSLVWAVCQIPDFQGGMSEAHPRLLAQVFHHLAGPGRRLPEDWVAAQVRDLDRPDGDVDTLAPGPTSRTARPGSPTRPIGRSAPGRWRTGSPTRSTSG
ncbi:MAG: hypothetical protein DMF79_06635 [Acidobacteria bacterium]|nr:MAG: hypothetical protein DMF79_06635 [Acidobacteriota bacterium]